jgi:hypothetical protein
MKEYVESPSVAALKLIGGSHARTIAERERVMLLVKDLVDSNEGVLNVRNI